MATICNRRSVGNLRVYRPAAVDVGAPLWEDRQQDRSLLLEKIRRHYKVALDRLTVKWRADMLARFLDGGICVGLLNPTSNIIANTLLAGDAAATTVVSKAEALTGIVDQAKLRDMERRSVNGLIAFLICFFPYLADWEAVHYLLLAEADLLVAARIVVEDRALKNLRFDSAATGGALKLALRCAALAAHHPRAVQLADRWMSLSHLLHKAAFVLSAVRCHSPRDTLCSFFSLFNETIAASPPLLKPWKLAAKRSKVIKVPYEHSRSLRRVLLDTIHGFYLQALARMPTDKLRSHYQRSLIKAGHCYGPLDPVSNIILNTIWYDAAFPPPIPEEELDMLGTMSLMRIEGRSFYGLVSLLCTRYNLKLHQALRCLLDTNLNLPLADPSVEAAVPPPRSSVKEAFMAAAIAAWHPKRDAQVKFLSSCKAMLAPPDLSLLQDGGQLSSQDVSYLARLLCPSIGTSVQQQPVGKLRPSFIREGKRQRRALRRVSKKIKTALRRYENQNSETPCYQLHVICGVNEFVSGPEYCEGPSSKKKFNGCYVCDDVYHHTHANFLATQNVGSIASKPILFFAELSNDDDDDNQELLCCPVNFPTPCAEPIRCLYCEKEGIRIVHPASLNFHGGELEFEKMVLGEDQYPERRGFEYEKTASEEDPSDDEESDPEVEEEQFYTNERMLDNAECTAVWVGWHNEDCIYVDSDYFTENEEESSDSD